MLRIDELMIKLEKAEEVVKIADKKEEDTGDKCVEAAEAYDEAGSQYKDAREVHHNAKEVRDEILLDLKNAVWLKFKKKLEE